MPMAIAHPSDRRMLERAREHMVKLADEGWVALRQNCKRKAPRLAAQVGLYAQAPRYKRISKTLRTLRARVGRGHREFERLVGDLPDAMQDKAKDLLQRAVRILTQRTKGQNKLQAVHAPEVEGISKGKAGTQCEVGVKGIVATTLKEGLVVGMCSTPGNPYDG